MTSAQHTVANKTGGFYYENASMITFHTEQCTSKILPVHPGKHLIQQVNSMNL